MSEFHLLRPWWLLALLPCLVLVWRLNAMHDPARSWRSMIAPELLPHLLIQAGLHRQRLPLALLAFSWSLLVLALAGPTWQREPAPFGEDTAVLVIVLKVTPSMQSEDIQPTRLARSVQKIHDLLAKRPGAKTALIAYSGSAHQVMPLTTDASIITSFASDLSPKVMPHEGDAAASALQMAGNLVTQSGSRGWILWIADAVTEDQLNPLQQELKASAVPVTLLTMSTEGPERNNLVKTAATLRMPVISPSADETDVSKLASNTHFSNATEQTGERWRDNGYWLVPILSAICLGWFRRGWMIGDQA